MILKLEFVPNRNVYCEIEVGRNIEKGELFANSTPSKEKNKAFDEIIYLIIQAFYKEMLKGVQKVNLMDKDLFKRVEHTFRDILKRSGSTIIELVEVKEEDNDVSND